MTEMPATYELRLELPLLDAKRVTVFRDEFEDLYFRVGVETPVGPLTAHCALPISDTDGMVIFRDLTGTEVGILRRLSDLRAESRSVLRREIEMAFLTPVIRRVNSVDMSPYYPVWDVETDSGRRVFEALRNPGTGDIRVFPDGRVFVRDADSNRYWIPNIADLDAASRAAIESHI